MFNKVCEFLMADTKVTNVWLASCVIGVVAFVVIGEWAGWWVATCVGVVVFYLFCVIGATVEIRAKKILDDAGEEKWNT